MMLGHAESLTHRSCGWEQLWLLRARSSSKKAQPTQLTMMMRMNSPQKTLQMTQKGVPMMQERNRRWKATILQILNRQTSSITRLAAESPSYPSSKMAMARQNTSQASSTLRTPSHFSLTTQLRKRIFLEISGLRTSLRTRWSRQRQMWSRKTTRMATSSECCTPPSACSSQLKVTLMGRKVRIRNRQIYTTKYSVLLKIRSQKIEQYRSRAYYSGARFVKSTIQILQGKQRSERGGIALWVLLLRLMLPLPYQFLRDVVVAQVVLPEGQLCGLLGVEAFCGAEGGVGLEVTGEGIIIGPLLYFVDVEVDEAFLHVLAGTGTCLCPLAIKSLLSQNQPECCLLVRLQLQFVCAGPGKWTVLFFCLFSQQ